MDSGQTCINCNQDCSWQKSVLFPDIQNVETWFFWILMINWTMFSEILPSVFFVRDLGFIISSSRSGAKFLTLRVGTICFYVWGSIPFLKIFCLAAQYGSYLQSLSGPCATTTHPCKWRIPIPASFMKGENIFDTFWLSFRQLASGPRGVKCVSKSIQKYVSATDFGLWRENVRFPKSNKLKPLFSWFRI